MHRNNILAYKSPLAANALSQVGFRISGKLYNGTAAVESLRTIVAVDRCCAMLSSASTSRQLPVHVSYSSTRARLAFAAAKRARSPLNIGARLDSHR